MSVADTDDALIHIDFVFSISGDKIAESYSKSPDLASWGAPVILKAEIPLKTLEGKVTKNLLVITMLSYYYSKNHNYAVKPKDVGSEHHIKIIFLDHNTSESIF